MAIADIISVNLIKVPLVSVEKNDTIRELAELFGVAGKSSDVDGLYNAVMERENQGSTGLGQGIAVPHAKTDLVKTITVAIGVSSDGIEFDSLDGELAHLFFMIIAPLNQSGPHIQCLSEIARIAQDKTFCRCLQTAKTSQEVFELFTED